MEQQRTTHKKAGLQEGDDLHSQGTSQGHRREEALQQIENGSIAFERLTEWHDDAEIALAAMHLDPRNFLSVSARLNSNRDFVLAVLEISAARQTPTQSVLVLGWVAEELRADREIVVEAVRQNGLALFLASLKLRNDREIVMEAVRNKGEALRFASEEMRADREVVLAAVGKNGSALQHAAEELRGNRDVVCTAVLQDGEALRFAAEELQADREVVMEAVQQTGKALEFASEELSGVREIVLVAVRQHGRFLRYASEEMRGDQEIALAAIESAGELYWMKVVIVWHMSDDLQNDPVIAGALIRKGLCLRRESEIMDRLEKVLHAVRALPEDIVENVVDQESVVEFSRRWEGLVLAQDLDGASTGTSWYAGHWSQVCGALGRSFGTSTGKRTKGFCPSSWCSSFFSRPRLERYQQLQQLRTLVI